MPRVQIPKKVGKKLMKKYGGKRVPKARLGKRMRTNVPERASCSVKRTITATGGAPFVTNTMYESHNVQIADYERASHISAAYQFYRIKNVALTFKFPYDTFAQGLGTNVSRPNFYYMLDKAQSIPLAVNLEGLKQMGARPRQCDEKPITISWAPTVLTEDETPVGPLPSQYKISPWLSSDVQTVLHNGVFWYLDQQFPPVGGMQYQVEIEVQFEFKKPLWISEEGGPVATGVQVAVRNNSSDGVVGGGDELQSPSLA